LEGDLKKRKTAKAKSLPKGGLTCVRGRLQGERGNFKKTETIPARGRMVRTKIVNFEEGGGGILDQASRWSRCLGKENQNREFRPSGEGGTTNMPGVHLGEKGRRRTFHNDQLSGMP